MSERIFIPAQPGWFLVNADVSSKVAWVGYQIICWEVASGGTPVAYSSLGDEDGYSVAGYMRPDGKVEVDGGDLFDSFSAYLDAHGFKTE